MALGVVAKGVLAVERSLEDSEYTFSILDPDASYGSPYGGFSRSSAKRLGSIALRLPNTRDEENARIHLGVRTMTGAHISCKNYYQDDLSYNDMQSGIFNVPNMPELQESPPLDTLESDGPGTGGNENTGRTLQSKQLKHRLGTLSGLCAQIHQGWWSYEWCYGEKVTQFHVDVAPAGGQQSVAVTDFTILGEFSHRMEITSDPLDGEVARTESQQIVVDRFVGGDTCAETGQPREIDVFYSCCDANISGRARGGVLHNGKPLATNVVSIQEVTESDERVCTYKMVLCTPLVCTDESGLGGPSSARTRNMEDLRIKDMSISDILKSEYPGGGEGCVHFSSGGW